jgi:formate dehydrogenase subunit gamma
MSSTPSSEPGHSTGESGHGSPHRLDTITRYNVNDRTNHWTTAIAFVLAALSGLALFHPAMFGLSSLFGGGPWTRILHPFIGLFMVFAFILLALRFWGHNRMEPRDWKWLKQYQDVVNNREDRLLVIWREYFAFYFPIKVVRIASLLHAVCAFVLICSILVHIYAAIWVKGSVHAMTRGTVTPGWAWKHHRAWYREMIHAANSRSRPD